MKERLEVQIPANVKRDLYKFCAQNGHTVTYIVNKIIANFIEERKERNAKKRAQTETIAKAVN